MDTMFAQAGKMEDNSDLNLSTCLWPLVGPACLPFDLSTCLSVLDSMSTSFLSDPPISQTFSLQFYVFLPPCLSVRMCQFVWKERNLKSPVWAVTPPTYSTSPGHTKTQRSVVTCESEITFEPKVTLVFLFLLYSFFVTLFQKWNLTVSRRYGNGRLYINTTLTVSAVSRNHSGTFTCTGFNEAGVAMATAHLRVVGKCVLVYLFILKCQSFIFSHPIPVVFTFPVLMACTRPNSFHLSPCCPVWQNVTACVYNVFVWKADFLILCVKASIFLYGCALHPIIVWQFL